VWSIFLISNLEIVRKRILELLLQAKRASVLISPQRATQIFSRHP